MNSKTIIQMERDLQWQNPNPAVGAERAEKALPAPGAERAEKALPAPVAAASKAEALAAQGARLTDSVIVGVSCGKDSVVTLDLCVRHFKKVNAYFMWLVPKLEFQERYLRFLESRYGISILRVPHWDLAGQLQGGWYRPHTELSMSIPKVKLADVEAYIKDKFACQWIAYGHRAGESIERQAMLRHNGGIDVKTCRLYPLAFWRKAQILPYLRERHIPLAPEYRFMGRSFGALVEEQILAIHAHFPKDYKRIKEIFPYVEAIVERKKFHAK